MMKKILALCIALLLVLPMAGCGETPDDNNTVELKDYYIVYNGEQVVVGVDASSIIPKLGEYTSEDGEACGTDEKDVIYTFSGIEIETHVSGSSEIVRMIKIVDDSQATVKGITIGSTRDEVIKAYGNSYSEGSSGSLRYEGDTSLIEFHFGAAGNVSNIYIKRK